MNGIQMRGRGSNKVFHDLTLLRPVKVTLARHSSAAFGTSKGNVAGGHWLWNIEYRLMQSIKTKNR